MQAETLERDRQILKSKWNTTQESLYQWETNPNKIHNKDVELWHSTFIDAQSQSGCILNAGCGINDQTTLRNYADKYEAIDTYCSLFV